MKVTMAGVLQGLRVIWASNLLEKDKVRLKEIWLLPNQPQTMRYRIVLQLRQAAKYLTCNIYSIDQKLIKARNVANMSLQPQANSSNSFLTTK